jgi:hypothetical protein
MSARHKAQCLTEIKKIHFSPTFIYHPESLVVRVHISGIFTQGCRKLRRVGIIINKHFMKKLIIIFSLFSLLLMFTSCQKGTQTDISGKMVSLYGKWKVVSALAKLQFITYSDTTSYQGTPEDKFTFSGNHVWYSHFQNDDEQSPFTVSGNIITLTNRAEFPDKLEIVLLAANKLILHAKAPFGNFPFPQCYQEMTINLEK